MTPPLPAGARLVLSPGLTTKVNEAAAARHRLWRPLSREALLAAAWGMVDPAEVRAVLYGEGVGRPLDVFSDDDVGEQIWLPGGGSYTTERRRS